MAQAWTRGYLRGKGFADRDIGWDEQNQMVTLSGKPLVKAREAGGYSFADTADLDNALSRINMTSMTANPVAPNNVRGGFQSIG